MTPDGAVASTEGGPSRLVAGLDRAAGSRVALGIDVPRPADPRARQPADRGRTRPRRSSGRWPTTAGATRRRRARRSPRRRRPRRHHRWRPAPRRRPPPPTTAAPTTTAAADHRRAAGTAADHGPAATTPPAPPPTAPPTAPPARPPTPAAGNQADAARPPGTTEPRRVRPPDACQGTVVTVTNVATGAPTTCTVTDRGALRRRPHHRPRRARCFDDLARARHRRASTSSSPGSCATCDTPVTLTPTEAAARCSPSTGWRRRGRWARTSWSTRTRCAASPASAGVGPGDHVVEVGAGLGSLTLALAETGAEVTAVEVDRHLVPVLRDGAGRAGAAPCGRRGRRHGARLGRAARPAPAPWVLVANLPVQHRHAARARPARRRARHRADAGDGAAGGGGAAGRRRPGSKAYGIPSVKVACHATAEVVGKVARRCSCPSPGSSRRWWRSTAGPTARPSPPIPTRLFALVGPGFGQRRKMLRRSLAGLVGARGASRPPASPPRPGPRSSTSTPGPACADAAPTPEGRRSCGAPTGAGAGEGDAVAAGHRRARRRLPPASTPRWSTRRPGRRARRSTRRRRARGRRRRLDVGLDAATTTSCAGRCAPSAARPTSGSPSGSRPAPGSAAVRPTPPRCCAGRASTTSTVAAGLGADVAVLPASAAGPGCRASARCWSPCRSSRATFTLLTPPFGCSTPAVYRAWDDLGGPTGRRPQRPGAGRAARSSPGSPSGATASATPPARRRCWPAAAAPGSSRAPSRGWPSRKSVRTVPAHWRSWRRQCVRRLRRPPHRQPCASAHTLAVGALRAGAGGDRERRGGRRRPPCPTSREDATGGELCGPATIADSSAARSPGSTSAAAE